MSRAIIKFNDGNFINIPADCIDTREGWIMVWNGDFIVAIVKSDEIIACYLSEHNIKN